MSAFKWFIRLPATIALLVVVWRHSHWSVALCLTLLSVSNELLTVIADDQAKKRRAL